MKLNYSRGVTSACIFQDNAFRSHKAVIKDGQPREVSRLPASFLLHAFLLRREFVLESTFPLPSYSLPTTYPAKSANNFMRLQRAFIYIAIKKIREQTEYRATLFAILNFAAGETLAHSTIINICSQLTQGWERVVSRANYLLSGKLFRKLFKLHEDNNSSNNKGILKYFLISMENDYWRWKDN